MTRHRLLPLLASLVLAGCAPGLDPLHTPSPAEIPVLESDFEADPGDVDLGLRLAAAYREAGRSADALHIAEALRVDAPDDPGVLVMAGLLNEDEGHFSDARARYDEFLTRSPTGALADEVRRRLELIRQEELREEVRLSIARENEVANVRPDPSAVGVFPFLYEGDDPTWEPLGLALSELLITDLAITGRLTVLERLKVQALLDEIALGESGFVQRETAARGGRILGSGHIVQGSYRVDAGQRIGVDAAVVEVGEPGSVSVDPISAEDAVDRLFDLEKQLALDLHEELGIELTPAERTRINERQTESVQALLAFGRGLAAQDAGDFQQAAAHFNEAAEIDPDFGLAQAKSAISQASAAARQVSAARQMQTRAAQLAAQRRMVQQLRNAPASVRQRILSRLGQKQRAALAELLGQDRVGTAILLQLVFKAPGGGAP